MLSELEAIKFKLNNNSIVIYNLAWFFCAYLIKYFHVYLIQVPINLRNLNDMRQTSDTSPSLIHAYEHVSEVSYVITYQP